MLAFYLITLLNAYELAAFKQSKHSFNSGEKLFSASTLLKDYFNEAEWPLDKALRAMGTKVPDQVMSMLQQKGLSHGKSGVRARPSFLQQDTGVHKKEDWTDDELERARVILNKMYDTEQSELDILLFDCKQVIDGLTEQMSENTAVTVILGEQTATGRADQLTATQNGEEAEDESGGLDKQLKGHQELCFKTLAAKKAELAMAEADYNVALKIEEMSKCTDEQIAEAIAQDEAGGAALVMTSSKVSQAQTITSCSGHGNSNDDEFFLFGGMNGHKFHTKAARFAMQRAAKLAMERNLGEHSYKHKLPIYNYRHELALLETSEEPVEEFTEPLPGKGAGSDEDDGEEEAPPTEPPAEVPKELMPEGHKCNVNSVPNCPLLADAVSTMVGELRDAYITIKTDYESNLERCNMVEADFVKEIKTWETLGKDAGIALAKAVTIIDTNTLEGAQKRKEYLDLEAELTAKQDECQGKKIAILDTMCGIKVVRLELFRMGMKDEMFADCEVGDWVPAQCSVSCGVGGGTQALTREVLVKPKGGCECPPLQMQQGCNDFDCPVDCIMNDWSGWSKCSKDCDGGVRSRSRKIDREPLFGGEPCTPTTETEQCQQDACDEPCTLDDWSDWSDCSKACSKGMNVRRKGEITPALGDGFCSHPDSPERFEEKPCNNFDCDDNVVCADKLDIVMLMDGSGSVKPKGFNFERNFYMGMAQRLGMGENGTKASLIVFAENITVEEQMTSDAAALEAKLAEVKWPAKNTNTAEAMGTALDVLMAGGRADAQSVVFVMTDGMPNEIEATAMMAEKVKEKARLIFVAVGPNLDMDALNSWVSFPPEMNVLTAKKFEDLEDKVGPFLADLCPNLACDEEVRGALGADYIGCQDHTISGAMCQVWTEDVPNKPNKRNRRKAHRGRLGLGPHNYCRNPDEEPSGIWCYTADPAIRWEHCEPKDTTEYVPRSEALSLER